MAPRGYTTVALVQAELGATLTEAQQTQCNELISEAESFIDRFTGRAWIVASPVTELVTVPDNGVVYLANRPVTAITSVVVRSPAIGASDTTLVADSTYELMDAANGILLVSTGYRGYLATVQYTHTNAAAALPLDIRRAATMLAAHWMLPRLHPEMHGVDRLRVSDGEEELQFSKRDIPDAVLRILNARQKVVFA